MPEFIPGLELNRLFFEEIVHPILEKNAPELAYSAALIGTGSEILGFDTEMSTDHHWGPQAMLFMRRADYDIWHEKLNEIFRQELPSRFRDYPVSYVPSTSPDDEGNGVMLLDYEHQSGKPVHHRVRAIVLDGWFEQYLGIDDVHNMTPADWLTCSDQSLRELTAGAVMHDDLGLNAIRKKVAYYPHDVWLYQMACMWSRIGQEEHLAPRAGFVGDNIGSWVIASRLVRDMMRLCFMIERQYAPYPKWFGTAFKQLDCAEALLPVFEAIMAGSTWQEREIPLCQAYEALGNMHNRLNITDPVDSSPTDFHGRPFRVIHAWRFSDPLRAAITDERVKAIARKTQVGAIDIFSDSTDLLEGTHLRPALRKIYLD